MAKSIIWFRLIPWPVFHSVILNIILLSIIFPTFCFLRPSQEVLELLIFIIADLRRPKLYDWLLLLSLFAFTININGVAFPIEYVHIC